MPAERNLHRDLFALALLVVSVFLGLALLTYDPADAPGTAVYPPNPEVANVCGRVGAWVAAGLFEVLGSAAYYLLISVVVLDATLLSGRPVNEPWLRAVGWLVSLVGVATLAAMAVPWLSPGPVIGAGGYLGAAVHSLLEPHFASAGAYVLVLSSIAGGLLLCTDYVLLRLTALVFGKPAVGMGRGLVRAGRAYRARAGGRAATSSDATTEEDSYVFAEDEEYEYEEEDEDEEHSEPAVRIAGEESNSEDDEYKEEDEDEEADQDTMDSTAAGVSGVAKRLARALRIPAGPGKERQQMIAELEAASRLDDAGDYELPSLDLLLPGEKVAVDQQRRDVRRKARILEKTFADFGFSVKVVEVQSGPVIAQFEVQLEAGLRLSRITGLADDLAIALRVPSVRIVAPLPGKNTVGIEVPNAARQLVRLREVIDDANGRVAKMHLPLFLGKDVAGKPLVVDLATLPHLLIAGRTGTGKSVCLNTIITSLLMARRPDEVKMLLIDPKMVELSCYRRLPHLMHPVVTDMGKAEAILAWAVDKMEERYSLLARAGVRNLSSYNQLGEEELVDRLDPQSDEERQQIPTHLPYIVIVADEMADLMMTAAKEVEQHIIRLAQKSRAVGIHLVLATQKPTVDVITGLIKSNLPARISFQVASRTDSRVVLDEMGADKLLGNGDMLFLWPGTSTLLRGQGTFISDDEINGIVDSVGTTEPQFAAELVQLQPTAKTDAGGGAWKDRDELYEPAVEVVVREGRGSVSLLQRTLGIGYGRAARLIDYMAEDGIVGQYNGSQAREVLVSPDEWAAMQARGGEGPLDAIAGATGLAAPPVIQPLAQPARQGAAAQLSVAVADDEDEADEYEAEDEYEYDESEGASDELEEEDWDEESAVDGEAEEDDEYESEYDELEEDESEEDKYDGDEYEEEDTEEWEEDDEEPEDELEGEEEQEDLAAEADDEQLTAEEARTWRPPRRRRKRA